jgi:isopenicillin-N N-acyltransferase-like protein
VKYVRATGTPYERGALIGEAFAQSMERSLAFNRRYLQTHAVDRDRLEVLLAPYLEASTACVPHLVQHIRGMADGADVPFLDLFFANSFEEVYGVVELGVAAGAPLERCTDVVLRSPTRTLLGHNEQWYAGDEGAVGLVLDVSNDGPAVLAPVVAGTMPLVGLNELGGSFGTMSLSATDERVGVPRALVARDLLEAHNADDAFRRANLDERAGGYSYMCAFPGGEVCAIETTATTAARLSVEEHTNHALAPAVSVASCAPSPGSRARLDRARALAESVDPTLDGMLGLLSDHADAAQSICVHPEPDDGDEGSTILFAMVCEPETRSMWLTPGHPCAASVEEFGFEASAI